MKKKKKFYVVWKGRTPGIYETWDACKKQIEGFKGAEYMGFFTKAEAEYAYERQYEEFKGKSKTAKKELTDEEKAQYGTPIGEAIAVDAAFNGKELEYQGVFVETETPLFHFGPQKGGSNNIGEFLAIVHALAYEKKHGMAYPVYSDSKTAISWIRQRKCKTTVNVDKYPKIAELIARAEKWLNQNDFSNIKLLKWHTEAWGEIPADFGRK